MRDQRRTWDLLIMAAWHCCKWQAAAQLAGIRRANPPEIGCELVQTEQLLLLQSPAAEATPPAARATAAAPAAAGGAASGPHQAPHATMGRHTIRTIICPTCTTAGSTVSLTDACQVHADIAVHTALPLLAVPARWSCCPVSLAAHWHPHARPPAAIHPPLTQRYGQGQRSHSAQ